MSSSSTQKQQQQRRRVNNNNPTTQQSRNTNAYFDRDDYHRRSVIYPKNYWNQNYQESNEDYYQHRNIYSIRKGRQIKNEQRYHSKAVFSSNNNHLYYDPIPPRHRLQQHSSRFQESKMNHKFEEIKSPNSFINNEQPIKPVQSASLSSTNSDASNHVGSPNPKDLHTKNLAAAAIAARQQNSQPQTNLSIVQGLMNSLILQQQQQQQPASQSQSTVQLQYQLTNALLATMIQQRLKETALQAQAQQIQAALPTLLAAQALVYQQQSGQLATPQQQAQSIFPPNVAHPGTKFNNRPLVKFPLIRPIMMPIIRPTIPTNLSRHRLGQNTQQTYSTTALPTYQQVQEIERGISLDEAIHLKGAIDIADVNNNSMSHETEATSHIHE